MEPLGFGGAIKDRRIIVFVKKQRNKDQVTEAELLSGMTIGRAEKRNGEMGVFISMYESGGCCSACTFKRTCVRMYSIHVTAELPALFHWMEPFIRGSMVVVIGL